MSTKLFIDATNLYDALNGEKLDYVEYVFSLEEQYGFIQYKNAYTVDKTTRFSTFLRSLGFRVKQGHGSWNVDIAVDVMKHVRPADTVILGSNDLALLPLLKELQDRAKNVIVFAHDIPVEFKRIGIKCIPVTKDFLYAPATAT
jgi:uncharacterized LabA/DUF88 family protein